MKIRLFVEPKIDPVFVQFIKNNQLEKYFSFTIFTSPGVTSMPL
ncbi:hypothetical protein BGP_5808 [Beggiatoa sp. PS]|nr:hypothetical protein BGP_5808 [Beggiatoa sp. PS]